MSKLVYRLNVLLYGICMSVWGYRYFFEGHEKKELILFILYSLAFLCFLTCVSIDIWQKYNLTATTKRWFKKCKNTLKGWCSY